MKKVLILSALCLSALAVSAQVSNYPPHSDRSDNIDWKEDSTEIVTIDDIIKTQEALTVRSTQEAHYSDVWSRNGYLNLSYNSTTLSPNQTISTGLDAMPSVPDYKSNWGASLQVGKSYRLHKRPISNVLQFYLDYTYIDLNINHFDAEGSHDLYTTSSDRRLPDGKHFHTPWNLEKYEANFGMALGPSVSVAPFTHSTSRGAHFLKFNMWYHLGYHASILHMKSDEAADANKEAVYDGGDKVRNDLKLDWGHGLTSTFGLSLTWKVIGIGYEYRAASLKYKSIDSDLYGSDGYKFKSSTSRVFLQFRL